MEGLDHFKNQKVSQKEEIHQLKEERVKKKMQMHKENIKKLIWEKISKNNCLHIHPIQRTIHQFFEPEVTKDIEMKEDIQKVEEICEEEIRDKRYPNLNQHQKPKPKKSRKRCWYCYSNSHYKKFCPKIQCFYCGRFDT